MKMNWNKKKDNKAIKKSKIFKKMINIIKLNK